MTWNFHQEVKCFSSQILLVYFLKCREQRNDRDVIARSHSALMSEHEPRHARAWTQGSDRCLRHVVGPNRPRLFFFHLNEVNFPGRNENLLGLNLDHWLCGGKEAGLCSGRPGIRTTALTSLHLFHDQPDKNHL